MHFEPWYQELKKLAEDKKCGWIITDNPEEYRDYYEDNCAPSEVLEAEISYADKKI